MDVLKKMFALNKQSPAQTIDSAMFRFAIGMLLVGVAYAVGVGRYFAADEYSQSLKILQKGIGLLVFPVVLPQFIRIIMLKIKLRGCANEPEGFMIDVVHKAAEMAFSLTFIALIALQVIAEDFLPDLPATIAIEILIATTLGLYCLFFFYFHSGPDNQDDDEFETEQGA